MKLLLVYVTFPNLEEARHIGAEMVRRQLAACVNLCPSVTSIYRWKGEVESSEEVLAVFKTKGNALLRGARGGGGRNSRGFTGISAMDFLAAQFLTEGSVSKKFTDEQRLLLGSFDLESTRVPGYFQYDQRSRDFPARHHGPARLVSELQGNA